VATDTIATQHAPLRRDCPAALAPADVRYEQLDGLRGIAALVVFIFHAIMMAPPGSPALRFLSIPVLRPFWDGPGAVMLFFVLSGFVLALPYTGEAPRKLDTLPFLIRRIARLYPAYWAVLVVALALRFVVFDSHGLAGLSPWASMHWSTSIGWVSIVKHFFLISPGLDVNDIDPVIWSLIIEMKISLIFPLLIFIVTLTTRIVYSVIVIAISIVATAPLHFVTHSGSSWARAVIMMPVFLLGAYLAKYRFETVSALRSSRPHRIIVAGLGAFLYGAVWITPVQGQSLARFGSACASGVFILLFISSAKVASIGTARVTQFLGKVSYSFYLVHLPTLIALASLLYPHVHSLTAIIALSLASSLLAAWVIHSVVEVPSHKWGKRLSASLSVATRRARDASVAG
jgi:peptidoglycan/LPS O-acetylase OafA/YrhL